MPDEPMPVPFIPSVCLFYCLGTFGTPVIMLPPARSSPVYSDVPFIFG